MAWSDMEPKQKGMLIAVIIVFIIIGYMVYKLFFAGSSPAPTPAAKAPVAAAKPQSPAAAPATSASTNTAASDLAVNPNTTAGAAASAVNTGATATPAVPQVVEMPKRELTPEELNLLEERRQVQQQYLQLVNQYQLTEMQNKVATSQSTLIKTQLETAKSEQQASKMGIVLPGQGGDDNTDKSLSGVILAYVGQKNGVWSAVLNVRGQYMTVKVGSHLPDDSVVSTISDSGLVLYKDGARRTLTVPIAVEQATDDNGDTTDDGSSDDNATAANANSGG